MSAEPVVTFSDPHNHSEVSHSNPMAKEPTVGNRQQMCLHTACVLQMEDTAVQCDSKQSHEHHLF